MRAGDEEPWGHLLDQFAQSGFVGGMEEGPEAADGDRLDPLGQQFADSFARLGLVQCDHHLAEAIDSFRHTANQTLGHDGIGLAAFGDVHH